MITPNTEVTRGDRALADKRGQRRRLRTVILVCAAAVLIVTVGFDQVDKDLRIENPTETESRP